MTTTTAAKPPALLTTAQVAAQLDVHPNLIYRLVREQKIASVRLGRVLKFTPEAVSDFIARGGAR